MRHKNDFGIVEGKSNLEKQMAGVIDPGYSGYGP